MQFLFAKALAAGFTASMALGGTTTLQMPNATDPHASLYHRTGVEIARTHESKLDSWIEKLIVLESGGYKNLKVLDDNGKHSFGCLQFQKTTFEEFGRRYGFIAGGDNIDKIIYDCDLQKAIAKRMIKEDRGNWRRWYTSVMIKKLGLPPKEEEPIQLSLLSF